MMWLLFHTLRLRFCTLTPGTNPYAISSRERFLYCVWHDSMVIPTFGGRHQCTTALISQHTDGSFVAQVLKLKRISAIRGSTNRIKTGALRELMTKANDQHIVITPDGPRGPDRCMSTGIAYLASRTGRSIIPTAYACSECWRIKGSWSSLIIPKPFARVILVGGAPIHVASGLTTEQLQKYVDRIQAAMDQLNEDAERLSQRKAA